MNDFLAVQYSFHLFLQYHFQLRFQCWQQSLRFLRLAINRSSIRKSNLKVGNFDGDDRADIFGSWDD